MQRNSRPPGAFFLHRPISPACPAFPAPCPAPSPLSPSMHVLDLFAQWMGGFAPTKPLLVRRHRGPLRGLGWRRLAPRCAVSYNRSMVVLFGERPGGYREEAIRTEATAAAVAWRIRGVQAAAAAQGRRAASAHSRDATAAGPGPRPQATPAATRPESSARRP